jgi:hypothetical protein
MRYLIWIVAIAIIASGCTKPNYRPAVAVAVEAIPVALTNSVVFYPKRRPLRVDLQRTAQRLAANLDRVDITECPTDFRMAWMNLVHTIENYQAVANIGHGVASGAAGLVAVRTGSREAGDVAARQFEEVTTRGDIRLAYERLENVCMKYDVQLGATLATASR